MGGKVFDMSTKRKLLEVLYPGNLDQEIQNRITSGESWRSIADHVNEVTGVTVSHESLRNWYNNPKEQNND